MPAQVGFQANLHHPLWIKQLVEFGKLAIDLGADGLQIDGFAPGARLIELRPGGSFDPRTMRDFREYLAQNFSATQLRNLGIRNIDTFNYGAWIRARGMEDTWNDFPLRGLAAAFYVYEYRYGKSVLREYRQELRDYARSTYGRNFVLSNNVAELVFHTTDVSDFIISEFFYFELRSRHSTDLAASLVKMMRAASDAPVVVLPEFLRSRPRAVPPIQNRNLIRFALADIYGAGGTATYGENWLNHLAEVGGGLKSILPDLAVVSQVNSFILDHPDLHESLEPLADVAVVYSSGSHFNEAIAVERQTEVFDH